MELNNEATNKYFCFRCNKNIPLLHSSREEINRKTKTYWLINYCPRCGTITHVEEDTFNSSNLLPRIGKIKSVLFVLLIGMPYLVIAWALGGLAGGLIVTLAVIGLSSLVGTFRVYEVENCVYERCEQYPELVYQRQIK